MNDVLKQNLQLLKGNQKQVMKKKLEDDKMNALKDEKVNKESNTLGDSQGDSQNNTNSKFVRKLVIEKGIIQRANDKNYYKKEVPTIILNKKAIECNPFQIKRFNSCKHLFSSNNGEMIFVGNAPFEAVRKINIQNKDEDYKINQFIENIFGLAYSQYYVVPYDSCFVGDYPNKQYLFFFENPEADLLSWFSNPQNVHMQSAEEVKEIIIQIALAYKNLHKQNILHSINANTNYLVFRDGKIKIGNFENYKFIDKRDVNFKKVLSHEFDGLGKFFMKLLEMKEINNENMNDAIVKLIKGRDQVKSIDEFLNLLDRERLLMV
jgi:serine/threonine protein kinase